LPKSSVLAFVFQPFMRRKSQPRRPAALLTVPSDLLVSAERNAV